eukprot:TRINITY_DN13496_c0_g2_i1.p1 TRINITY_DN13496_c0_g2~~TRINITY_DN13496_c0_g2_i1.p1  ORF type:complete len:376 (+),score=67.48 TRINITY_DN13496_c0_g2_i1:60-1130(+)
MAHRKHSRASTEPSSESTTRSILPAGVIPKILLAKPQTAAPILLDRSTASGMLHGQGVPGNTGRGGGRLGAGDGQGGAASASLGSSNPSTAVHPNKFPVKSVKGGENPSAVGFIGGRQKLSVGSLRLIGDNWEHCGERLQQLMTENTDFTVVGVIGPPAVGKSTILNYIYGTASASASNTIPPFPTHTDDTRAAARHCTSGVEMRISPERFILLDTQPVFAASVLVDILRPDGTSSLVVGSDTEGLPGEVSLEAMALQVAAGIAELGTVFSSPQVSSFSACQKICNSTASQSYLPCSFWVYFDQTAPQPGCRGSCVLFNDPYVCFPPSVKTNSTYGIVYQSVANEPPNCFRKLKGS